VANKLEPLEKSYQDKAIQEFLVKQIKNGKTIFYQRKEKINK